MTTVSTPEPQNPVPGPAADDERRFTWGLILDVFEVLRRHGYARHSDQATGAAVGVLLDLVETYEGRRS